VTAADELTASLALIADAIKDARAHEHGHGLATHDTRKLPADALRVIRRWTAAHGGTVEPTEATAPCNGQPTAGEAGSPSSAKELPTVPVTPSVSIRIPEDLREDAEAYGREHRWSLGQTTRVALERLVGYEGQPESGTEPRAVA
jgi:hypothetical protein